jgi:hypothetical protein
MIAPIVNTANTAMIGIHSGEVTHHHDQSIVLVNFSTRKMRKRTVPKPRPEDAVSVFDILFLLLIKIWNSIESIN